VDIDFGIDNKRQGCKIGTVCVWILLKGKRVNGRDESEEI
jgi:hypothetical protein